MSGNDNKSRKVGNYNIGKLNIFKILKFSIFIFIGKTIGEGTFGKVKLGTHILTSEKVAIKILEKDRIVEQADVERVAREIHILKILRHPNIIQLYEVNSSTVYLSFFFQIVDHRNSQAALLDNGICLRR